MLAVHSCAARQHQSAKGWLCAQATRWHAMTGLVLTVTTHHVMLSDSRSALLGESHEANSECPLSD